METPTQAIRDFLQAVDRGYLGQMPSGFNDSAFVVALRNQAAKPCAQLDALRQLRTACARYDEEPDGTIQQAAYQAALSVADAALKS